MNPADAAPVLPAPEAPLVPTRTAVARRLAVLAAAGLGAGLAEAVQVVRASPGLGLLVGAVSLTLWMTAFVVVGLPWLAGALSPWSRRVRVAGDDDPASPSPLAWAMAIGACGLAAAAVALRIDIEMSGRVAPETQPYAQVAGTLAAVALALTAAPALASLLARLARAARRSLPGFVPAAVIVLAGIAAWPALGGYEARLQPLAAAIALAPLGWVPWRRAWRALAGMALVSPVAALALLAYGGGQPGAVLRGPAVAGLALGIAVDELEAWSDDDGDGFGDRFGGLDCDDGNPAINPTALDKPKNGVDENCQGGDSKGGFKRPELPGGSPPRPTGGPPHVILLVLDAVRFDHFGPEKGLTPNLDEIIAGGTRFTRVFSTSSSTRMAVPAMLTGRWIGHTGYREDINLYTLDSKTHTLAEALAEQSYQTAAVVPPFIHGRIIGLERGFGRFISFAEREQLKAARGRTAPLAVAKALEVLEGTHPFPLFLYVHLDDPHAPYSRTGVTRPKDDGRPITRYAGEIARMDADLAPLLARIEELRKDRPVLVAVTADHGEAFGEHGSFHHGRDVYQAVLHVPMVLNGPGVPEGNVIDAPVDLLDLGVTLARAGDTRLRNAEGHSLWGLLEGKKAPSRRPLFAELRILHAPYPVHAAVIEWPFKLIRRMDTNQTALYDLSRDPGELQNLWSDKSRTGARLAAALNGWIEAGRGPAGRFSTSGQRDKAAKAPRAAAPPAP